ncbi:MAG TPA: hypothetical protein VMV86_01220, partial [Methanosarcinales archaeon]|nr:hypothetical protein [Methanosarcinales archaeon]
VKHWELLTDDNKGVVLSTQCQKFTASWIREHWGELKETEGMLSICLKWQIVPIDILKEVWHTLTSQQKALIVKLQAMDRALITTALNEGWEDLLVNYQQISKKQFLSVWEKLPKQTKTHAFRIQQCVKKLTLEELPIFLTDENMDVRKHTNILYKQLIKKGRT